MPKNQPERFQVTIESMAQGGQALGKLGREHAFLPYAIPGERVEAQVLRRDKGVVFAQGVKLLEASADRVLPRCDHFGMGRCWACQWQHMAYSAQALLKQDLLIDALSRLGKFDDATLERAFRPAFIAAPQAWQYAQIGTLYPLSAVPDAPVRWGLRRMDGGLEPIDACPLMTDAWHALYDSLDIQWDVKALTLAVDSTGAHFITLHLKDEELPELLADLPMSVNALSNDNEPLNLVGDSAMRWEVGERWFQATAGCAMRANLAQVDALVAAVLRTAKLDGRQRVLELYSGVGIFSAFMAARCQHIDCVDSYPPAINDAHHNLAEVPNVTLHEASASDFLSGLTQSYDLMVLDPPASGIDDQSLQALAQQGAPRLVLISANPTSLARDCASLARAGYRLQSVQGIDFAPQTAYVEAVCLLERR